MILYLELIRLLEQRGYTFATAPDTATELVRHSSGDTLSCLHQRAKIMDGTQDIAGSLHTWQKRVAWLRAILCATWVILGFGSTYALMQHNSLNFFLILVGVLGMNTLMLVLWLWRVWRKQADVWMLETWLPKGASNTPMGINLQAVVAQLYAQRSQNAGSRWAAYAFSHQLALCALGGMALAAFALLTVRQYTFNWQSTLWGAPTFALWVDVLAWLPAHLGFATPDAQAVQAAQNHANTEHAAAWGSLLLGSIVCYGIAPRFVAWGICRVQQMRFPDVLDLHAPYYQNIVQKWQQRITDSADDYRADEVVAAAPLPTIALDGDVVRWAVLLDMPTAQPRWFAQALGQDWVDKGSVAEREDFATLQAALKQETVQLLVGVRANSLPDRGNVRRLVQLADAAHGGMALLLLHQENANVGINSYTEIVQQWRNTAREHAWVCVEWGVNLSSEKEK